MAGDNLDMLVQSYYIGSGTPASPVNSFTDVLNSLAGGIVSITAGGKGTLAQLTTNGSNVYSAVTAFMPNDPPTTNKPKAYLNWITLDDQLKAVSSGASVIGNASVLNTEAFSGCSITKSGYIYIWVSNETPGWPVYFDNLKVVHRPGPLLEETHYYPFGLTMAGISDKALKTNYAQNKYRYNGIEYDSSFGLDYYEAFYRDLDPQIGRWTTIDPKVEDGQEMWSPYVSNYDNPVRYQDPKGDCPTCLLGALIGGVVDAAVQVAGNMANGQSFSTAVSNINGTQVAIAAAAGFVTSGVSAIYSSAAATGTAIAVSEVTTQAAVVGTSSVLSQVNDNISKGQDAMNISPVKMAMDIATDHVATNISKSVATTSVTTAERQLNRTERVAANDPASSGRASNVQQAQNKVNGINNANAAKKTTVSNAISSTAGAVSGSSNSRSQMGPTAPVPKQDATYVKKSYIRNE